MSTLFTGPPFHVLSLLHAIGYTSYWIHFRSTNSSGCKGLHGQGGPHLLTHPLLDGRVPRPFSAFCPLAPWEWRSLSVLFCTSVLLVPSKSISKDWFPVYTQASSVDMSCPKSVFLFTLKFFSHEISCILVNSVFSVCAILDLLQFL